MSDWILAIKVEGLGDDVNSLATDKRYRFASGVPTGGIATWRSLYLHTMAAKFPGEIATRIDFRAGTSTIGTASFELLATDAVTSRFYRLQVDRLGLLRSSIDEAVASLIVEDSVGAGVTDLAGTTIMLEREAITLVSHTTPPDGEYSCTRGRLGTLADSHNNGVTDDREIYNADHGHLLTDRELVLIRVPADGAEADEEVVYRGAITGIESPTPERVVIRAHSLLELLQQRKICGDLWRQRLRRIRPGRWHSIALAHEEPSHEGTNADGDRVFPLSVGGEAAVIQVFDASATDQPAERVVVDWTERTNTVSAFDGVRLSEAVESPGFASQQDVWEFYSLHPDTPDLRTNVRLGREGAAGFKANPFTLTLQLLTTTAEGNNGSYDLGDSGNQRTGRNLGAAIPASLIDVDAIETLRARVGETARLESLHLGFDGKPIELLPFLQQRVLRPFGCVLTVGEDFKLTVVRLESVAPLTVTSIVEADFVDIPGQMRRLDTPFDSIEVQYWDRPGIGPRVENFRDRINRRRQVSGRHKDAKLDARGIRTRGPASVRVQGFVQRFHRPIAKIRFTLLRSQSLWPGQVVTITHSKLMGRKGGTRGNTAQTYQIVSRRQSLESATISYEAIYVGAIFDRVARVAGALKVASYSAPTITVVQNAFTANAGTDDEIQNDLDAFAVGDYCVLLDRDHSVRDSTARDIATIPGSTTLTFSTNFSPAPAADDLIVPATYDDATAAQQTKWTWMADPAVSPPVLGAADDDAYEWDL